MSNHLEGRSRVCPTTGLTVCKDSQLFIRFNAVLAVIFLLVGAVAAILLALTRWPTFHLLDATGYYRFLTLHGLNMLVFWIIFFEVAVLYFTASVLLKCRLFSRKLAWLAFILMVVGAGMTDFIIFAGKADVLMTSYAPMAAHWAFFLGLILFAVGALVGVLNFFLTIWLAKKEKTYNGSMPLVTFGATAAAIIAVVAILHGAVALIPAFLNSIGLVGPIDAMWYRLMWWGFGHTSQQINVCAMVSVWYLLSTLTVGARPLNQAVCRGAFILYIFFINLASAHHLLVDPGVGAGWKIWNTSYAMYLAVLASLIHGFTVPASIEVAQRRNGHDKGLFGWLTNAPWKNPGFSAMFLSLVIFGFLGGITGVTLGTQQINITAHNTLRIPGHFHATVVGGTTLAFMGLTYYVVPLIFQREFRARAIARIQPYIFGAGITIMAVGMSFAGSYGVPRRHYDVTFSGANMAPQFDSGAHTMLGVMGVGATLAFIGMLAFILLTVTAVFFGKKNEGVMESWPIVPQPELTGEEEQGFAWTRGTLVLVILLLVSFAVYYFANWKALADVWHVR